MKEHALVYLGESKQYKNELISLFNDYQFDYTFLDDQDMGSTIASLFNKENETTNQNEMFPFNFILFRNIEHEAILIFYKDCASRNFAFSHKAVLTEHNKDWKLHDLLVEIANEHEFFQMYGKLHQLLKEANEMNPEDYEEESFETYQKAFIGAFIYLKQEKLKKEIMQHYIDEVIKTKKNLIKK